MPDAPKYREAVHKAHYWLSIDFEIRADSLEDALKRTGALFRRPVRQRLREGLVYMGAHSARVRRKMVQPKNERTIIVAKNKVVNVAREPLPSAEEFSRQEAEKRTARKVKKARKANAAALPGTTDATVRGEIKKKVSLLDIMGGNDE
jgi:hypothetical protein